MQTLARLEQQLTAAPFRSLSERRLLRLLEAQPHVVLRERLASAALEPLK